MRKRITLFSLFVRLAVITALLVGLSALVWDGLAAQEPMPPEQAGPYSQVTSQIGPTYGNLFAVG